jgi:hypothetical protein
MSEIAPEADISRHDKIDANDPEADIRHNAMVRGIMLGGG